MTGASLHRKRVHVGFSNKLHFKFRLRINNVSMFCAYDHVQKMHWHKQPPSGDAVCVNFCHKMLNRTFSGRTWAAMHSGVTVPGPCYCTCRLIGAASGTQKITMEFTHDLFSNPCAVTHFVAWLSSDFRPSSIWNLSLTKQFFCLNIFDLRNHHLLLCHAQQVR